MADNKSLVMPQDLKIELFTILHGDTDHDGKRTMADAINILRALAGWSDFSYPPFGSLSDWWGVNGDCRFDSRDAVLLLRYLAGWDIGEAPMTAESFSVMSSLEDRGIAEYASLCDEDAFYSVSSIDDHGYMNVFTHKAEFEYELKKYFSSEHTLYLMDRDGEMTADSCNYMSLLYKYDAEFFEKNDLVMYIHPADKDDVHIDIENSMICIGDWIDTRFTVTEREEEYPCRNVITLIPVEKNSLLGFYPAPGGVHLDSAIEK